MRTQPEHQHAARRRARRPSAKVARIEARTSAEDKALLERAAALRHQTLTQFILAALRREAEQTIREHDIIALSARDSQRVMDALLNPQPVHPWLREAAERYTEVMAEPSPEPPAAE